MDKIIKPGIALFVICVVAATLLGFAYDTTREPIAIQQEKTRNSAMREVLPEATDFKDLSLSSDEVVSVYEGTKDGAVIGYAITTNPKGYGGEVNILTGIDAEDDSITGISILSHNETPGLGANAEKPAFKDQYIGKGGNLVVVKSVPSKDDEIEAMTSATITTKAVTKGVNASTDFYNTTIKEAK